MTDEQLMALAMIQGIYPIVTTRGSVFLICGDYYFNSLLFSWERDFFPENNTPIEWNYEQIEFVLQRWAAAGYPLPNLLSGE